MSGTVWESRFQDRRKVAVFEELNSSIGADAFLFEAEVAASRAYARALGKAGVIGPDETSTLLDGLRIVGEHGLAGANPGRFEDVHSAVELMLVDEIGGIGKKLHTGRSRNEQVVTDERLFLKSAVPAVIGSAGKVQKALLGLAEGWPDVVMPGLTHLQDGQPILFSHYIMSFFWAVERGKGRLRDALKRLDVLPLGSGAVAGSTVPVDREAIRAELGFASVSENSLDAVGDRGFILETLFALAALLVDLSRLAEDLVIFSSSEFGFIELDPSVATSSSLMPQKKNPDMFELLRAAPARLFGLMSQLFMVLQGLPSSYNKDLQEDKAPLRDGLTCAGLALEAAAAALPGIKPRADRMRRAVTPNLMATDLVDILVAKGLPFRDAHGAVGAAVGAAEAKMTDLAGLSREVLAAVHPLLADIPAGFFDPEASVRRKRTPGSTAPEMVAAQIRKARAVLGQG